LREPVKIGGFVVVAEVTKEIVGSMFNGLFVVKVTDGTMDTVPEVIYRYKLRGKTDYIRDKEERVIIKESPVPLYGDRHTDGRQVGTELIEVICAKPDDKHVWWIVDPKFTTVPIDRDPVTRRMITTQKIIKPYKGGYGTYQEFVDAVNAHATQEEPETEPGMEPTATPASDEFTDEDIAYIKANYQTMTDDQMAEFLGAETNLLRDFRVKTLKLKKKPFGK